LQIPPLSTLNDVKLQYKKLAKKYHSDIGGNEDIMKELNWAFKVITEYINSYKFSFSEEEILKQYPDEILKKFKV